LRESSNTKWFIANANTRIISGNAEIETRNLSKPCAVFNTDTSHKETVVICPGEKLNGKPHEERVCGVSYANQNMTVSSKKRTFVKEVYKSFHYYKFSVSPTLDKKVRIVRVSNWCRKEKMYPYIYIYI